VSDSDPVGLGLGLGLGLARLVGRLSIASPGTGTDLTARLASMNGPQQRVEHGAGPAVHDGGEDSG
jgi:hypothetical protein